jgi:uncharacterized protein (DUF3084 family)
MRRARSAKREMEKAWVELGKLRQEVDILAAAHRGANRRLSRHWQELVVALQAARQDFQYKMNLSIAYGKVQARRDSFQETMGELLQKVSNSPGLGSDSEAGTSWFD